MNYEDREQAPKGQEKTSEENEFFDGHVNNKPTHKVVEISDRRKPEKHPSMIFTVFVLSTALPVLGLVLYALWRNDEVLLSRAALIGFFLNVLLTAFTILSMFIY